MSRGKHQKGKSSSLPDRGAVPHLPDGVTVNRQTFCSECGPIGPGMPHKVPCPAYKPTVLEFTVGVCVKFRWDADNEVYARDGQPYLTDGGLFSDACEGPWAPDVDDWIGLNDPAVATASNEAFRYVNTLTGLEVPGE